VKENITYYKEIVEAVRKTSLEKKQELIQEYLYLYLDNLIQRSKYLHRNKGKMNRSNILVCDKCGNNWTNKFVRNGTYFRALTVKEGYISKLKVPRVKCTCCGKKIRGINGIIKKHSRLWYDTDLLIKELFMLKASVREIRTAFNRRSKESIGKGTIINNIRNYKPQKISIKDYPKEVGLDGFWSRGKSLGIRQKNIALIGVDQNSNSRNKIVGWKLCDSENYKNWKTMIEYLEEEQNINHHTGLKNYITDGQKGLLKNVVGRTDFNTICSFHILGNIKQNMTNQSNKITFKLMSEAKEIFQQPSFENAEKVLKKIKFKWKEKFPKAIKNLEKSLKATKDFWNNKETLAQTNNKTERMVKEYKRKIKQMEGLRSTATAESVMELITTKINSGNQWFEDLEARIVG